MNGLLCDLITQTGAEIALLVRSEGALIVRAGNMDEIEAVGMLAALIYGVGVVRIVKKAMRLQANAL